MSFQSYLQNLRFISRKAKYPELQPGVLGYHATPSGSVRGVSYGDGPVKETVRGSFSLLDPDVANRIGGGGFMEVHAPFVYARMLAEAARPGGVLSDLNTNRSYTGEVQGILAEERNRSRELPALLAQQGFSSGTAMAALREDPLRTQRSLSMLRSEKETELQENRFNAMKSLADVMAQAEREMAAYAMWNKGRRDSRRQFRTAAGLEGAAILASLVPDPTGGGGSTT